jgi:hypothetical protein
MNGIRHRDRRAPYTEGFAKANAVPNRVADDRPSAIAPSDYVTPKPSVDVAGAASKRWVNCPVCILRRGPSSSRAAKKGNQTWLRRDSDGHNRRCIIVPYKPDLLRAVVAPSR